MSKKRRWAGSVFIALEGLQEFMPAFKLPIPLSYLLSRFGIHKQE